MFQDKWYRQKNGVPTGGTLCVQLANIAVYYVLSNKVYNNPDLMRNIISSKRYIDDGSGLFRGTKRMFSEWITQVNTEIGTYGLFIDEYSISPPGEYVSFLDINFCIDKYGHLQTDLYVKPTDARSYLYFGSSHPNHVFSGIVFSGCLRLRRIINCNERLAKQLEVLKTCFLECNYPKRMVNNIVEKVKGLNRTLVKKQPPPDPTPSTEIRVISTFEGDSPLVEVTEAHTSTLSLTRSFSSSSTASFAGPPKKANVFGYVKRTGSSLRRKFVKAKELAMGNKGNTKPCNRPRCKCCEMICDHEELKVNNHRVRPASGSCTSYNIIYMFICSLCTKPYVGRTVNQLNIRTNQHRSAFYKVLEQSKSSSQQSLTKFDCKDDDDDIYSLGVHLVNVHGVTEKSDFNDTYRVLILENCSPKSMEVLEHKWIHKLKSLRPQGINRSNPFSIPLL